MTVDIVKQLAQQAGPTGQLVSTMFAAYCATATGSFHAKSIHEKWHEFSLQIDTHNLATMDAVKKIGLLLSEHEDISALPLEAYKTYPTQTPVGRQAASSNSISSLETPLRAAQTIFALCGLAASFTASAAEDAEQRLAETRLVALKKGADTCYEQLEKRVLEFSALSEADTAKIAIATKLIDSAASDYFCAVKRESNILLTQVKKRRLTKHAVREILAMRCKKTRSLFDDALKANHPELNHEKAKALVKLQDQLQQSIAQLVNSMIRILKTITTGLRRTYP